jgi:hypothetical protein
MAAPQRDRCLRANDKQDRTAQRHTQQRRIRDLVLADVQPFQGGHHPSAPFRTDPFDYDVEFALVRH